MCRIPAGRCPGGGFAMCHGQFTMASSPSPGRPLLHQSLLAFAALLALLATAPAPDRVGRLPGGGTRLPTWQAVRPAGETLTFRGRPVDLALSPDGKTLFAKDNRGLVVVDAVGWKLAQELAFPAGGGSMHGLAVSADGQAVYATTAQEALYEIGRAHV